MSGSMLLLPVFVPIAAGIAMLNITKMDTKAQVSSNSSPTDLRASGQKPAATFPKPHRIVAVAMETAA